MSDLKVVVYTHDQELFDLMRGLIGTEGSLLLAEDGDFSLGQLVCIDFSYPHRTLVLDNLRDYTRSFVIAVISANPFVISQLEGYDVDACLAKPINSESMQALLVGTKARLAQKGLFRP